MNADAASFSSACTVCLRGHGNRNLRDCSGDVIFGRAVFPDNGNFVIAGSVPAEDVVDHLLKV